TLFSVLDQTVNTVSLTQGEVADAVNPLTDVGVVVNSIAGTVTVVDLRTLKPIGNSVTVGTLPQAVAIDPGKNVAVIANSGSNDVSILPLGPIRTPQITELSPGNTFTATGSGSLTVTVQGFGFTSGAQVRLDGTSVPTVVSSNGRQATATVSGSLLAAPRRFSLDVMTSGGSTSNEENFTVIGAIPIGLNPIGVAIDSDLGEALVTNQGAIDSAGNCTGPGSVSVVNLSSISVTNTFSVGTCPEGVAVLPRLGLGVIANNGSNDATVVDYVNNAVAATVPVGTSPAGVAIQPDSAATVVANSGSNTVSEFTIGGGNVQPVTIPVDQRPFGISIDPIDDLFAVTATTQNTVDIVNLTSHFIVGRLNNFEVPSDVAFDPITNTFLVANSLLNDLAVVDPRAFTATPIRLGINPTAIAYNFQSGTGVTVNNATNTLSVFNFLATNPNSVLTIQAGKVEAILPMGGSAEFSVAIDPLTNIAAVVDQANGRLLLIPLPR
ncbi:MAG TPA: YncE family protein, partial [Candidatus Acidoferrales bacterium]|nr:YncE family protein [Candidatus Acidoferrales bacterium]